MRNASVAFGWISPLLIGAALAAAAETAAAVLLYSGEGLLRALSLVLAIQAGALGLGLWTAPSAAQHEVVDAIRRRWLFTLVAFLAAAAYSGAWTLLRVSPPTPLWQGLGLALMGGLPLFAGGALLGEMARADRTLRAPARHGGRAPSLALAGAALAFLVTGPLLLPRLTPPSILLLGMVALSGGALLYGRLLDARRLVEQLESRWTPFGEVRVEEWVRGSPRQLWKVLIEDRHLRGAEEERGAPAIPDEAAALASLSAWGLEPKSVLVVGGGSLTVSRHLRVLFPNARVVVLEENVAVTEAAMRHFSPEEDNHLEIRHERLRTFAVGRAGTCDLVLVDTKAPTWSSARLPASRHDLRDLASCLKMRGIAILGRLSLREGPAGAPLAAVLQWARTVFPAVRLYAARAPRAPELSDGEEGIRGAFMVMSGEALDGWPEEVRGFLVQQEATGTWSPGESGSPEGSAQLRMERAETGAASVEPERGALGGAGGGR